MILNSQKYFFRVMYVQLATPRSILDLHLHTLTKGARGKDNGGLRETLWEERCSFLKSALRLLVSCHVVVWAQEGAQLSTNFLEQLQILQARLSLLP